MKKIVGILSAAAVLAASVFAADVSAKVKVDGSILNLDKDGNFSALQVEHKSEGHNPDFSFYVSGDNAGASMSFYYGGDISGENPTCNDETCWNKGKNNGWCDHSKPSSVNTSMGVVNNKYNTVAQSYSVWFKPIDALKVTVGQYSTNLNQETIDWCQTETGIDKQGIALDLNVDALFATVFFAPGWGKYWFSAPKDGDVALSGLYFKAGYGADFGRIQGMFRLVDNKNMWFGAGYDNTFGSVKMFVNALAGINTDKGFAVRGEAFASTNIDIVGLSVFVAGGYAADNIPSGLSGWRIGQPVVDKASVGATFKATFALDGFTPYIYVKDANFLADTFAIEIKPGVTGNVGMMGYEVAVDMNISGSDFTLNVPVSFTVSF